MTLGLLDLSGLAWAQGAQSKTQNFPYVDKLITGSTAEDAIVDPAQRQEVSGRRSFLSQAQYFRRQVEGQPSEAAAGLATEYRHETQNYGLLSVQVSGWRRGSSTPALDRSAWSGRFSLRQRDMPLGNGWRMTNQLGSFRSSSLPLLQSRHRFALPTTNLVGLSTRWRQRGSTRKPGSDRWGSTRGLVIEAGRLARPEGTLGYGQRRVPGSLIAAAWAEQISPSWGVGAHLAHMSEQTTRADYTAQTVALSYANPERPFDARIQLLSDSQGRFGTWFEGGWRPGRHRWRVNGWTFDPNLSWLDTLLSTGQQGVALRYDVKGSAVFWGASVEVQRNDPLLLENSPTRAFLASGQIGRRLDRRRSVGLQWQWRDRMPLFDDNVTQEQQYRSLSLYGSRTEHGYADTWRYAWVRSAAQAVSQVHELTWGRDMLFGDANRLGFVLGAVSESSAGNRQFRPSISTAWEHRLDDRLSYNLWFRYARDAAQFSTATTTAASAKLNWEFSRNWQLGVQLSLNSVKTSSNESLFESSAGDSRGRSMWLTVRHRFETGQSFASGSAGAGDIEGIVFQDVNSDGIRQASEKPAAGVIVVLDGRERTRSGPDGRYRFALVRTGPHRLDIDLSSVRLPWGIGEKLRILTNVSPRQTARHDINLVKTGE